MSRFLSLGKIKRAAQFVFRNHNSVRFEGRGHGTLTMSEVCLPRFRRYSLYLFPSWRHSSYTSYRVDKESIKRLRKNFTTILANNNFANYAQLAWKNLSEHNPHTSSALRRIAQAVSLALSRHYVVVPGMLALTYGESKAYAREPIDTDFLRRRNTLVMRAEDTHAFMVSLIKSLVEGVILLVRALYLTILFSPSIAMAPFADSYGPEFRKRWLHLVHRTLEQAGPAFIKWGQWAATRPDLFPRDLCSELSKLHAKAPEHNFAFTKETIETAFGRSISEIFDDFEEKPVASGSIAQVHRATLRYRYHGRPNKPMQVAVKVRHPGVGDSIRRDFEIINVFAKISNFIPTLKWLRLDESIQQFAVFMMSQVDLAREAANLSRFIYNFRGFKDVSFPKPVYPLVHPTVLVETFEPGESVSHYIDELEGNERLKSKLAHIGTDALLKMILVDNLIHADMHPGNILVRVSQKKSSLRTLFKSKPHLIFIDVGMTAELSQNDRVNLLDFFKAVAHRDGRTAAECTLRLSKEQNCPKPEAYIKEMKESFDFWGSPEGEVVHPADCMHQVLELVRHHKVNVDGNVCTVLVTILVLEGWQRKLDPDYDIMRKLRTLLLDADWAKPFTYVIDEVMAP
ncbi:hypothetical protein Leryth_019617 [Lithospermum erythrorhizon]|nr:hypothetical protein Leryth_019617 [Lithospermum erythrorhizon]